MKKHAYFLCAICFHFLLTARADIKPTIHVFVALCDNENQGIVPVPEALGNGNDPDNNLYWGAMYGVKTFFKKSNDWQLISEREYASGNIMERIAFKHRIKDVYLVADAYRGSEIQSCIESFLQAAAGKCNAVITVGDQQLGLHGRSDLIAYVGHNGLMDFSIKSPTEVPHQRKSAEAIILCCKSQTYFKPLLDKANCKPLLLTTGFMAPEAYTLEAALNAWLADKNTAAIRRSAAEAYHTYQQCGLSGSLRLFWAPEDF